MKLYIARDKNKQIYLYPTKPTKGISSWCNFGGVFKVMRLDETEFPEIKWEDEEPTEVELVLKNNRF